MGFNSGFKGLNIVYLVHCNCKRLFVRTNSYKHINKCNYFYTFYKGKGKGKAIPLQAWTSPKGSRRLRLPEFKTVGT